MATETTKIGAIIGLLGSIILLIVGLSGISMSRLEYTFDPNYPTFVSYIGRGVTIAISAFGLFGSILVFRDNNIGYTILLVAGIAGIIGTYTPIYIYVTEWGYIRTFYLSNSFLYVDLVLMLVGGILGFALAEKKERKE